jgi:hypothetical protein
MQFVASTDKLAEGVGWTMRIDIQAEHIQSFQNEKREKYLQGQVHRREHPQQRRMIPARLLDLTGNSLILTGQRLQKLAGSRRVDEPERQVLREAI